MPGEGEGKHMLAFKALTTWQRFILSAYLRRRIREHARVPHAVSPDYHPPKAARIAARWPEVTAVRYEPKQ